MPDPTPMNRERAYELAAEHEAEAAAMNRSGAPSAAEFHLRTAAAMRKLADQKECLAIGLKILVAELAALREERDAEMERVKACEHIAECDEGWEKLRNLCPSTAAVAALVDTNISLTKAMNDFRDEYGKLLEEREREERLVKAGWMWWYGCGVFNWATDDLKDPVVASADRAEAARLAEAKGEGK